MAGSISYRGLLRGCVLGTLVAVWLGLSSSSRAATPQYFATTDSYYLCVHTPSSGSWNSASTAAMATFFAGRQGRLAVITSQAENDFVLNNVIGNGNDGDSFYLGAFQNLPSPPASNWQWIDGEPFSYTNWRTSTNEPNHVLDPANNTKDVIEMFNQFYNGQWNDIDQSGIGLSEGYVIEYPSGVPEPGSLGLLVPLAAGTTLARRRRRGAMVG